MNLYIDTSYKTLIKDRLAELRKERPALSLKNIASKIPIQYTYLSKAMNDSKTHVNEDHLFTMAHILDFVPEEIDYLLLCRSYETATDSNRKKYLYSKLEKIRKSKKLQAQTVEPSTAHLIREMGYLFDPLALIVHMSLDIPAIQKDPRLLCSKLGLTTKQLTEILRKLAKNDIIEWDEQTFAIKKIKTTNMHFGRDHSLTRIHQSLLKTMINSQLVRTAEEDKHSFLATFSADRHSFEKVKEEFQDFIKRVEKIVSQSRSEKVYQLNFDIFQWF